MGSAQFVMAMGPRSSGEVSDSALAPPKAQRYQDHGKILKGTYVKQRVTLKNLQRRKDMIFTSLSLNMLRGL
jgi:hypothetical protein